MPVDTRTLHTLLAQYPNLESLDFGPSACTNRNDLYFLNLSGNKVTNTGLLAIATNRPNLEPLNLSGTSITDDCRRFLAATYPNLQIS